MKSITLFLLVIQVLVCSNGILFLANAQSCMDIMGLFYPNEYLECDYKRVELQHHDEYDYITFTPPAPWVYGGEWTKQYHLVNNLYNITYGVGECNGYYMLDIGVPSLIPPPQPKCRNSVVPVDFQLRDAINQVRSSDGQTSLPLKFTDGIYTVEIVNEASVTCNFQFNIAPLDTTPPPIQIIQANYTTGNGSIIVGTPNTYASIQLLDQNKNLISSAVGGVFQNVKPGSYYVQLNSTQCDIQLVPVDLTVQVYNIKATFAQPLTCVGEKVSATFTIDGFSNPQGNVIITSSTTQSVKPGVSVLLTPDTEFVVTYNGTQQSFVTPKYSIPMTHTVSPVPTCGQQATITLNFTGGSYSNIKVTKVGSSVVIPLVNTNQFPATYGQDYLVTYTPCTIPINYYIAASRPIPAITFPSTPLKCWERINVTIDNYFNYQNVNVTDATGSVYKPVNGQLIGVYPSDYAFSIVENNCQNVLPYQYNYNIQQQQPQTTIQQLPRDLVPVSFTYDIVTLPTCSSDGQANVVAHFGVLASTHAPILVNYSVGAPNEDGYPVSFPASCQEPVVFWKPDLRVDLSKIQVKIVKQPTCRYMDDGIVYIQYEGQQNPAIYIDNVLVEPINAASNQSLFAISAGKFKLQAHFSGCTVNNLRDFPSKDITVTPQYSFTATYSTTQQLSSDCDTISGELIMNNPSQYSSLTVNGSPYQSPRHPAFGILNVEFNTSVTPGTYCVGSITAVVTAVQDYLTYTSTVIRRPTTYTDVGGVNGGVDGDGIVIVQLKNVSSGLVVPTDQSSFPLVPYGKLFPDSGVFIRLPTVVNNVAMVKMGYCFYKVDLTFPDPDPQIPPFTLNVISPPTCQANGVLGINFDAAFNVSLVIKHIQVESDDHAPMYINNDNTQIFGLINATQLTITISYMTSSVKTYTVNVPSYTHLQVPPPQFEVKTSTDCTSLHYILQFQPQYLTNHYVTVNGHSPNAQGQVILLKSAFTLFDLKYGVLNSQSQCQVHDATIELNSSPDQLFTSSLVPVKETCYGSMNGMIQQQQQQQLLLQTVYNSGLQTEKMIALNSLPAASYLAYGVNTSNPYCRIYSKPIQIGSNEPLLTTNTDSQCIDDKTISSLTVGIDTDYTFNNISVIFNSSDIGNNRTINSLPPGQYTVNITISDSICPRVLSKVVQVGLVDQCSIGDGGNNGSEEKKKSLIIGLVVGIVGGAAAAVGAKIAHSRFRRGSKSTSIPMGNI